MRAFLGWTITGAICGGATGLQNGQQGLLLLSTAIAGAIIVAPCGFLLCFGRWNARSVAIGLCAGLLLAIILEPWTRACYAECLVAGALTASVLGSLRLLLPRARQLVFDGAPVTVFEPQRGRSTVRKTP